MGSTPIGRTILNEDNMTEQELNHMFLLSIIRRIANTPSIELIAQAIEYLIIGKYDKDIGARLMLDIFKHFSKFSDKERFRFQIHYKQEINYLLLRYRKTINHIYATELSRKNDWYMDI